MASVEAANKWFWIYLSIYRPVSFQQCLWIFIQRHCIPPILIIYSSFPWINSSLVLLFLFLLFWNNILVRSLACFLFRPTFAIILVIPPLSYSNSHLLTCFHSMCRCLFAMRVRISQRFHCVKIFYEGSLQFIS